MQLYGHPVLKFRTKEKLHVSKEPGIISWATLLFTFSLGVAIDYYFIPDHFLIHAGFLLMCLLLGLNLMETWEDFIMDKEENLAMFVNRSWYHGFSMKVPEENVKRFPLNSITSVIVNKHSGIDIMRNDGSCSRISSEDKNLRSFKKLRKEIATFLHLERIEYLTGTDKIFYEWDTDPWAYPARSSDNQESDTETLDSNPTQQESQFQYGQNIKIISGPS